MHAVCRALQSVSSRESPEDFRRTGKPWHVNVLHSLLRWYMALPPIAQRLQLIQDTWKAKASPSAQAALAPIVPMLFLYSHEDAIMPAAEVSAFAAVQVGVRFLLCTAHCSLHSNAGPTARWLSHCWAHSHVGVHNEHCCITCSNV